MAKKVCVCPSKELVLLSSVLLLSSACGQAARSDQSEAAKGLDMAESLAIVFVALIVFACLLVGYIKIRNSLILRRLERAKSLAKASEASDMDDQNFPVRSKAVVARSRLADSSVRELQPCESRETEKIEFEDFLKREVAPFGSLLKIKSTSCANPKSSENRSVSFSSPQKRPGHKKSLSATPILDDGNDTEENKPNRF